MNTIDPKRPCCAMLRKLCSSTEELKDPETARKAFDTLSEHCVLMRLFGRDKVKWDLSKSDCCLAVFPDEIQTAVDELGKTQALNQELHHYDTLLAFMNGVIAHNAVIQQISDKFPFFLLEVRESEKRFGRVPDTSLIKDDNRPNAALSAAERLQTHPLLDKPQFDGIAPKSNPAPVQNPEAAQNAEELQLQLQLAPRPGQAPTPSIAPKLRPTGG